MIHDRARINVQAGDGGDGCTSFRREAHVPRGGPDGGDGGRGGDVVLECDASLRDLQSFKRRTHYKARRGGHGQGALRHGADGGDLVVRVPPGTHVSCDDGSVFDLVAAGQRAVVARGGPGGRGNKRFATPTRQAPRFAQRGLPGEQRWFELRLKLLADVGLVGLPNAGKSSLLVSLTRASSKVAAYPFTTIDPVLGTIERDGRQLVIADIPGLIEGASDGAGLGHDFLAHIERTRLLVHVLDLAPNASLGDHADGSDPVANYATIERELEAHDPRLARLPRVLALSKADLVTADQAEAAAREWSRRLGADVAVVTTSSATRAGLGRLVAELFDRVPLEQPQQTDGRDGASALAASELAASELAASELAEPELVEHRVFRPAAPRGFSVERTGAHAYRVQGDGVERLLARYDLDNDEALAHVEGRLRRMGVIEALANEGFEAGDDVEIAGVVFELDPE